jgi:hypothetical protein
MRQKKSAASQAAQRQSSAEMTFAGVLTRGGGQG